jgi:hypothetical protein
MTAPEAAASSTWAVVARLAEARLLLAARVHQGRELGVAQPELPLVVLAILRDVDELPLAGRVVHERDEPHDGVVRERLEVAHDPLGADLAAHVQEVLDAERARRLRLAQRVRGGPRVARPLTAGDDVADGQPVEDGRDPGRGDLHVVGDDGGKPRPANPRTWREVPLQDVGVQLHRAGDQEIAAAVDGPGGHAPPVLDRHDRAVERAHRPVHHGVRRHHARVGPDDLAHAAAWSVATRVARASRTPASWNVPTMAVPRARASAISSTTTARLAASSEAVGSSRSRIG